MTDVEPDYFSEERCAERLALQQQQMDEMHQLLADKFFIGTSADGMVSAKVQANGSVSAVDIDPYVVHRYGVEGLGDWVMLAISAGMRQAADMTNDVFGEMFASESKERL